MGQYLLIPFLRGWTSIYQLFWCSPGVQGFDTLPNVFYASACWKSCMSVSCFWWHRSRSSRQRQSANHEFDKLDSLIIFLSNTLWIPFGNLTWQRGNPPFIIYLHLCMVDASFGSICIKDCRSTFISWIYIYIVIYSWISSNICQIYSNIILSSCHVLSINMCTSSKRFIISARTRSLAVHWSTQPPRTSMDPSHKARHVVHIWWSCHLRHGPYTVYTLE